MTLASTFSSWTILPPISDADAVINVYAIQCIYSESFIMVNLIQGIIF